jgi:hypothetical protein
VFLISTRSGGIGVNLVAANRVVLMDGHFNPTHDVQAICRCYRYGQESDVSVYRLLCEGTLEEKIFKRTVNKQSLAARVMEDDSTEIKNLFSASELDDLDVVRGRERASERAQRARRRGRAARAQRRARAAQQPKAGGAGGRSGREERAGGAARGAARGAGGSSGRARRQPPSFARAERAGGAGERANDRRQQPTPTTDANNRPPDN